MTCRAAIPEAMKKLGGLDVPLEAIYIEIAAQPFVTPYHRQPWANGQLRYKCWMRSELNRLKNDGYDTQPRRLL